MTVNLPLPPSEEARLAALARAKGVTTEALIAQLIRRALAEVAEAGPTRPTRSLHGLLAKYGPAPSAEEIDQNRAEMFANFPRTDF